MARNRLFLAAQYMFHDPVWAWFQARSIVREFLFISLFEKEKAHKLKAILLGIRDAVIGKFGKLDDNRLKRSPSH